MKIEVDMGRCVGAGQCVLTAPSLFDQNDAGLVEVLDAEPGDADVDAARTAAEVCPSGTITLHD